MISFVLASFMYGLLVGHYKIFPFDILASIKSSLNKTQAPELSVSQIIQQNAFTQRAPTSDLIYSAILGVDDLYNHNERILTPRADFLKAYENILIGKAEMIDGDSTPILKLPFTLNGRDYNAFAYGNAFNECEGSTISAALIIPGSGNNQSQAIYQADPSNYHYGILEALNPVQKILVQIKPNRDARAWHNGAGMRVNGNFIYNWQINMGGSYSVSYLVEAMALMKYLNQCSDQTVIAGLSQGGGATLYVALQASPDLAIISSGYSVSSEQIRWAGFSQLMGVPGSEIISTQDGFIDAIKQSSTRYLFTWGRSESFYYREEAYKLNTASLLESTQNAIGVAHDGGHIFPVTEIRDFVLTDLAKTN